MSGFLVSIFTLFTPLAARLGPNYLIGLRLAQGISNVSYKCVRIHSLSVINASASTNNELNLVKGAAMPAISTLSSRWFAALERGFMLGIAYSGFAFATSTTYPIAAFFCENTGWPGLFYFAGNKEEMDINKNVESDICTYMQIYFLHAGIFGLLWCVATFFLIFEWPETHPRIGNEEIIFVQKYRAVQYTNASNGPTVSIYVHINQIICGTFVQPWSFIL